MIKDASEVGADGIELRCVPSDLEHAEEIFEKVTGAGLMFGGISTGRLSRELDLNFSDTNSDKRKAGGEALCRMIDIAEIFGTDILVGSAKGNQFDDESLDAYTDRLADTLSIANEYASGKSPKIQLEVINRYEINALTTCAGTKKFLEDYELGNCYVHLDMFHMNIEEDDLPASIEHAGDKLGYFQFADSNRLWPGAGHIDFEPIFEALKSVNFQGVWSLEYQPFPDGKTAAANGVKFLRDVISKN
ncbi:sugar phosphate isomerase/epimerase family protein [Propionimicrobium lymphophilum]|uniref:sugar phosphate isomerase/epimerase family protein n=1 Tax=Propionimicrobium lymphophilum TaxID=33012 RepID=UPI00288A9901|nr:sugar phosphate isomerase/epimerase family protein [Propionimicrobium lymphophilum]